MLLLLDEQKKIALFFSFKGKHEMPADSEMDVAKGNPVLFQRAPVWFKAAKKVLKPWQSGAGPEAGGRGLTQRPWKGGVGEWGPWVL